MPKLEHVVWGIKRSFQESEYVQTLPSNILLKLRSVWEEDAAKLSHTMLWAGCCTCFFGGQENNHSITQGIWSFNLSKSCRHFSRFTQKCNHHRHQDEGVKNRSTQGIFINFITEILANQEMLTRERLMWHLRLALTKVWINPDLYAGHIVFERKGQPRQLVRVDKLWVYLHCRLHVVTVWLSSLVLYMIYLMSFNVLCCSSEFIPICLKNLRNNHMVISMVTVNHTNDYVVKVNGFNSQMLPSSSTRKRSVWS